MSAPGKIIGAAAGTILVILSAAVVIVNPFGASPLNRYAKNGTLSLPGLSAPVSVHRDEKGMAFIYAENREDLWLAQGFVTAQDRLFQMELTRLAAAGRLSELAGEEARESDLRTRTLGFRRQAEKHAGLLNENARLFLQRYSDGVNAFMETRPGEIHLEFRLAGLAPRPWSSIDSLAILYFMGWHSAANMKSELIAQMLVDKLGPEKASGIFPVNVNPDAPAGRSEAFHSPVATARGPVIEAPARLQAWLAEGPLKAGSNNWVAAASRSAGGGPVVANDPHLEANILPGPWYPCGLITPQGRAVGASIPGIGGMILGRTDRIAFGVTNAYGDTQDLYIETVDPRNPDNYMEGAVSVPFEQTVETLKIRDRSAASGFREENVRIRSTRRGPVISEDPAGADSGRVITVRWSSFETMAPSLGLERVLECRSAEELRSVLEGVNHIAMNFVFADADGDIGWQATGKIPIRSQGAAIVPFEVTSAEDNWAGWIPWTQMPQSRNPDRGWAGTCNHMSIGPDFPYYYTNFAAPSFRYRRLAELLDAPERMGAEDHWGHQLDAMNLLARELSPQMARVLSAHADTRELGRILAEWDYVDGPEKAGPTVFHSVFREFALLVYSDELGDELSRMMLRNWAFWQERLLRMAAAGDSPWFDRIDTPDKLETRDDLFHMAALRALEKIRPVLGADPRNWLWGEAHTQEFLHPLRLRGFGKGWLGGGKHPARGSEEALCRGIYDFNSPFQVVISASLRMVADLSDPDKILAVLPGGVGGRLFDPHTTDQIGAFMNGDHVFWWFSDTAIREHTRDTLVLKPPEVTARPAQAP